MGDRVVTTARKLEASTSTKKPKKSHNHSTSDSQPTKKKSVSALTATGETIADLGDLRSYQPSTEQAKASYESILTMLSSRDLLGSQQDPQVIRDAADLVISILRDPELKDPQRHEEVSQNLTGKSCQHPSGLSTEKFTALLQRAKDLDDYGAERNLPGSEEVDDEMGVAVVFDDSDAENDDNDSDEANEGVVQDSSSDEDDQSVKQEDTLSVPSDEDEVILQGSGDGQKKSRSARFLSVHEIDAQFLQRLLSKYTEEAEDAIRLAAEALDIIDVRSASDERECENRLLVLLGFDAFDAIKLILQNRIKIWACVSMKNAKNEEDRIAVEKALAEDKSGEGQRVWEEMHSSGRAEDWTRDRMKDLTASLKSKETVDVFEKSKEDLEVDDENKPTDLDLDALALPESSRSMGNRKCELPDTSWRAMKKGYEEVHVPAVKSVIPKGEKLVEISDLPEWTHSAFAGMDKLNRIQSKMCDVALHSSENILLCAPTGAGKTNVACLAMLNILGQYKLDDTNLGDDMSADGPSFDLQSFKIVYIAPMKALVQEVVKNFSNRLKEYGVTVRELSGDSSLTRHQISETQVIVTTPEKWDVVTRQGEGRAFTQLVKLVIIDEIHLLHDDRGPVLETIVSRIIRQVENTSEPVRIVGLSATLPNYKDVATFLRVDPGKGLFFFDHSYRPVPLQMQYIGITERNAFKRFSLQNQICYEKAVDQRKNGNQMLIFVHSRAETGKTAKALRDIALEKDELSMFVRDGGATQEILKEETASVKNADLKEVLQYGFAIHHAGMAREDRELVEDLFADRHIAVLCTTATLAWGVNLPAHAVIIKGTQIYDPSKGRWAELSPLDILQMLGRAGRPQYDSEGEGIILTQHSELQYYLSLTNLQLPVESQLIKSLADHLNAEIVLGSIQSVSEGVEWLSYSFLFVRMLQNPELYGVAKGELESDPLLKRRRRDLIHSAASVLEKSHLIRYERRSGLLQSTPLGRVASRFYISHSSMSIYNRNMRPNMSDIELLRLFSLSGEFNHIMVRENEKLELSKLAGRVPIPVKESPSEASAKVNILLQAYISRLRLEGFALSADMAFIQQSASRLMRALFEIALRRNWASLAKLCLDVSNMVSYRIWRSQSPLRQFQNVPDIVCRKLERKSDIEWARYADLSASDLGELVGVPKMGRILHKLVQQFPRLDASVQFRPLSRSLLHVELTLTPSFQFDVSVHGYEQLFHVLIEDVNGENILHHEIFSLKSNRLNQDHVLTFTVPILEPLQPAYFCRVVSDRFLHSTCTVSLSLRDLILPAKFSPPTEVLDLQPLSCSAVGESTLEKVFPFKEFNPIQTQTFHELFKTDRNCLICSPSGSGKTTCALFAILRMLSTSSSGRCIYVVPDKEIAQTVLSDLMDSVGKILPLNSLLALTGEISTDLRQIASSRITVATAAQFENLSRRWRQRKIFQSIALVVFDELHFLGGQAGPTIEVGVSRARQIASESKESQVGMRLIGLSVPIANARDVGEWMGVSSKSLFNFSPKSRPSPLEIYFHAFEEANYAARLLAMGKPVYTIIDNHPQIQSVVYVPSRRQAQLTAIDLLSYRQAQGGVSFAVNSVEAEDTANNLFEPALEQVVQFGIAFVHAGMTDREWSSVIKLYEEKKVSIIVCPVDVSRRLRCHFKVIVVMSTEAYDGREGRHIDYSIPDILFMMGRQVPNSGGKCFIMCHAPKKEYLKKLVYDPLPIESHLDSFLHDPLNAEIVSKTIRSMQDAIDYLTWTFLYRRLTKNPSYYGLRGTSSGFLSEHLSEMIETVISDLEESKCCRLGDEADITPLNLGMIASYYNVQYRTVELIASSISEKTKVRGILEILAASWEFSSLPIRFGEEKTLKIMARKCVHGIPDDAVYDSNTKALILLQAHFSRMKVSPEMRNDSKNLLQESLVIIQAIVDVISSSGWLKPALAGMELSQMVVQGLWNKDNVLKQIPHFSDEIIQRCVNFDGEEPIESVFDILSLDDDIRKNLLQLPDEKMADVAVFCNTYPSIDVSFKVLDPEEVTAGDPVQVEVVLEREVDEDISEEEEEDLGKVAAPLFPSEKKENWWLVVGDASTNLLLSVKKVTLGKSAKLNLEFLAPEEAGDYDLTLFCMSDSYLGCDQEFPISLSVGASDTDDEESNNDDD